MPHENKNRVMDAGVDSFDCDHPAIYSISAYRAAEELGPRTRIDRVRNLVHAVEVLDEVLAGGPLQPWTVSEVNDRKGRLTVRWFKRPTNRQRKVFNIAWRIFGEPVVEHVIDKTGRLVASSTESEGN